MFYENLKRLCEERGTTPTAVAKAIGISTSMTANWKKGGMPRGDTLQKLADYFGVSTDHLLRHDYVNLRFDLQLFGANPQEEKAPAAEADEADELNELLQELKTRPEMKMLFSLAKGATKEDVELAVQIIERMRRQGGDGE